MDARKQFIGSGLIFPLEINPQGRPEVVENTELINTSLRHILSWPVQHKYFNEGFGSRLEELLEEPNDTITHVLAKQFVRDALEEWERRIQIRQIQVEPDGTDKINIIIMYHIRNTKIEETFIYPFYRKIIY